MKLKLDLHDVYNRGEDIDRALRSIIDEAVEKKAPLVEIIPGKGSGQLKKLVLRFLDQKEIKTRPRGKGLPQLRKGVHPLPMEVTSLSSSARGIASAQGRTARYYSRPRAITDGGLLTQPDRVDTGDNCSSFAL